jgi:adhesin transport system membrane fusion protein
MTDEAKKDEAPAQAPAPAPADKAVGIFNRLPSEDVDFATDIRSAILIQSPSGGRSIVYLTLLLLVAALVWAYFAEIEEITRGDGKVIPSRQIQVVQNLEGGIVAEILVSEGDEVAKDALLLRIDDTRFSAPFRESRVKYMALKAKVARLRAESLGAILEIEEDIKTEFPSIAQRELELYESRQEELSTSLVILQEKINQRSQELEELKAKQKQLSTSHYLIRRELNMTAPLVKEGAVSEVELLRLKRDVNNIKGELTTTRLSIPRIESRLLEAESELVERTLEFRNKAKIELNDAYSTLESLSVSAVALEDRLSRTSVKSPVHGTVNRVLINTVGGIIQPGMDLIEIVPLEDSLLIEARIRPSDIAFLRADQKAVVKFSAYDFTIYGGLDAKVEHISADSIVGEDGNSYYIVRVRTDRNHLGTEEKPLPIIPGMVAQIDILTGQKTILSYLMKPLLRAKGMALRER